MHDYTELGKQNIRMPARVFAPSFFNVCVSNESGMLRGRD